MRKFLLCAVLFVGAVCTASAQEQLPFGVRVGMNLNSFSVSGDDGDYDQLESRVGFHVGVVMDWNVVGNFYVQPGLYFTTRGAKYEDLYEDESYSEKWNMNYLQIPILASYRFLVSDKVKIDINVGPYFAVGLNGKIKYNDTYGYETDKYEVNAFKKSSADEDGSDLKRFDAGLRFGGGLQFKKFYVGLNYDFGFLDILGHGDYGWADEMKMKNNSFQISLGYNF